MAKINYRCDPEERRLPLGERKRWHVHYGDARVASIVSDTDAQERPHNLRIWKAHVYSNAYDPLEFPHVDEQDVNRPHVLLQNDEPVLYNPQPMTMREARTWVRNIVHRGHE